MYWGLDDVNNDPQRDVLENDKNSTQLGVRMDWDTSMPNTASYWGLDECTGRSDKHA
jgi:hypothetical protein